MSSAATFHGMSSAEAAAVAKELSAKIEEALDAITHPADNDVGFAAQVGESVDALETWLRKRVPAEALLSWQVVLEACLQAPKHDPVTVLTAFQTQAQIELSIPRLRNRALRAPRPPRQANGKRINPAFKVTEQ